MESPSNGSGTETTTTTKPLEKKRLNRAPSPARPFLKDVHSRSSKPPAAVGPLKSPKLTKQQQQASTSSSAHQNRSSTRRHITVAKDKTTVTVKSITKSSTTATTTTPKKTNLGKQAPLHAHPPPEPKGASKPEQQQQHTSSPILAKGKKGRLASISLSPLGHGAGGSPIRVPTGASLGGSGSRTAAGGVGAAPSQAAAAVVQTASAAEGGMSQAQSGGTGGGGGGGGAHGERGKQEKTGAPFKHKHHQGAKRFVEDDLLREIEDLRSENDYLKDEVEELRAEMEEVRDSYLEEEVYQLQELRRELDRSNKNCRILQYRLRKAEQKSLRAAQTGHVDGELLRNLEQDLKVAKDVSVRLHNELESVEDKRSRAEDENEQLRQKIIEVEISKQAVYNELERAKE
ncbi:hypothetical protein CRUP_037342, partial [Coryphaenoides rupestris]